MFDRPGSSLQDQVLHSLGYIYAQVKEEKPGEGKGKQQEWVEELRAEQRKGQGQAFIPPIVYASRTHSQLAQVIRELRATSYRWSLFCWS